ncbi:hypothetical protein, partial [Nocardioides sp.]|uniref:hypothetical protein n=1 Tax=Nocardioides sp. TaxID=35761 RepID=UPI001A29D5E7
PKVVTRTRRRGGSRSAGTTTAVADVPASAEAAVIDTALGAPADDGLMEMDPADAAPHVPVKRKGRKR